MLKGISLVELAKKIEANRDLKQDFIAPTEQLKMHVQEDKKASLIIPKQGEFPVLPLAHDQIAARVDIPKKYYERMRAAQ